METEWDNWFPARVTGIHYSPFFIFEHQPKYNTVDAR